MSDHETQATSLEVLDVHLRYMRAEVEKLVAAMPQMATKADIAALSAKFESYATHDDMRALRTDVEHLRQQVEGSSVPGTVKKWAEWAQRLSAIAAFLAVAVGAILHVAEKLK